MNELNPGARKLLILSCSKSKHTKAERLPAIDRYNGPTFKLLRKFLGQSVAALDVYVLSAEYGLIEGTHEIPYYDRRMTLQRAQSLRPEVSAKLKGILKKSLHQTEQPSDIFVCLGREYRAAFADAATWLANHAQLHWAAGSLGTRLAQMHWWLYGQPASVAADESLPVNLNCVITLREIQISLHTEQVLELAQNDLARQSLPDANRHSWYVEVEGQRVGVKWLVSQATRLPVSAFHTDEARRILHRLGIKVHLALPSASSSLYDQRNPS